MHDNLLVGIFFAALLGFAIVYSALSSFKFKKKSSKKRKK